MIARFCLLLICFCFTLLGRAQDANMYSLNWHIRGYVPGHNAEVLLFDNYDLINQTPVLTVRTTGLFDTVSVVSIAYEETALLYPQTLESSVGVAQVKTKKGAFTYCQIPAVRKNTATGKFELLQRVELRWINKVGISRPSPQLRTSATANSNSSVLSSGIWYKLEISATGIYKLSYDYLATLGINVNNIDPRQIRIFGNGGGMLPQPISSARYDDLRENHIIVEGESDGVFNQNDAVYFYGVGPDTWSYNGSENQFVHNKNLYSDKAYYFLTIGSVNGLRIADQASQAGATQVFNYYDDRQFLEQDLVNTIESGRYWWGDEFSGTTTRNYGFSFPGIVPNSTIYFTAAGMSNSSVATSFSYAVNTFSLPTQSYVPNTGYLGGRSNRNAYMVNASSVGNSSAITVRVTYNKGSSAASVGYLDFLALNVRRYMKMYGAQNSFRTIASNNASTSEFHIAGATSNTRIWDVSDPTEPFNQQYFNISPDTAAFGLNTNTIREFVAWNVNGAIPAPIAGARIDNQDLHSIGTSDVPDLVIIAHPDFQNDAERLANYRTNNNGLKVVVVTTEQVWNEFSSGAQDVVAIRDFMKMLYDRGNGSDTLGHLLLFGDCSYDFKNRIPNNTNFVPAYQSYNSLDMLASYSSEDYFTILDDSEGAWDEPNSTDRCDIGVGRLPVQTAQEAAAVVDKLIRYDQERSCRGKWQTNLMFAADDGDTYLHMDQSNTLATTIETNEKAYNVSKYFLPAYTQETSPGGETCSEMRDAITRGAENGAFIFNYTGHGGFTILAQENVVDDALINSWSNYDKLPLMVTATCEFGRYDMPEVRSGAEQAILRGDGGSIANISSTRVVFAAFNFTLNSALYDYLFTPVNGAMPLLGQVYWQMKNASVSGPYNRNYALLGDPSMVLNYPANDIVLTKINNKAVAAQNDTMKALSKIRLDGEVRTPSGALLSNFNGTVNVRVFDKPTTYATLPANGTPVRNFLYRNSVIYEGQATVTAGVFSCSFVVPKDIDYTYGFGKVAFYGLQSGTLMDAAGFYDNVKTGGSDPNAPVDNIPPHIQLFLNDVNFVNGGLTGSTPLLLATLIDSSGINISNSGIGHEIALYVDNATVPVILNSYYTAEVDNYKSGKVQFKLNELSPGTHTVRLKAWDTYNNASEAYLEFVVASGEDLSIDHLLNYPNPFTTRTVFHFDHNRAGEDLDVMVEVFTTSGKLVKTLEQRIFRSDSHIQAIEWDGKDDFGDNIGRGVYVYKTTVRCIRDGSSAFKYQKLVILH